MSRCILRNIILDYEVLCRARNRHLSKHEMRPDLGRISWKICSYGGIIHPVEKWGLLTIRVQTGQALEWQGMSILTFSVKKARFLTKTG